jgi:hypothetical protein
VRQGIAATAANDYGAINIWDDKYGKYRCESMTYGVTVESKSFTRLVDVRRWATDWLHKISTGDFEQVPYLVGKEKP